MDTFSVVALFVFVTILSTLLVLQEMSIGFLYKEVGALKRAIKLSALKSTYGERRRTGVDG